MSNNSFFQVVCEPYGFGPFGGSFLTICFIDLILPVIGFLFLVGPGSVRVVSIRQFPTRLRKYSYYQTATLVLSAISTILPGINIIYNSASLNTIPWFSYFQLIFHFVNWLFATIFAEFEFRKGVKNGWQVLSFWICFSVLGALRIQAYAESDDDYSVPNFVFVILEFIVATVISINAFFFNTTSSKKRALDGSVLYDGIEEGYSEEEDTILATHSLKGGEGNAYGAVKEDNNNNSVSNNNKVGLFFVNNPEMDSGIWSRMTFSWFNPYLDMGYYRSLTLEDFAPMRLEEAVSVCSAHVSECWEQEKLEKGEENAVLLKSLLVSQKSQILISAFYQFFNMILVFVPPVLLQEIFKFMADPRRPIWHGFLLSFGLLVSKLCETVTATHSFYTMVLTGIRIEQSLLDMVFRKSLRKRVNISEDETTAGEILNLQAVDAGMISLASMFFNLLWCFPIQIIGAIIAVGIVLGLAVLGPIAVLITIMPLAIYLWGHIFRIQKELMALKDERGTFLNEVLQGIQIIKFFNWESRFVENIERMRAQELSSIKVYLFVQTCSNVLWGSMQSLLGISSFLIYTARGEILTVDKAFVTVSLLNIMLIPLIIFPVFIGLSIGAAVACGRINKFLISEEINKDDVEYDPEMEPSEVKIKDASFSWEKDKPAVLSDISFNFKGQLVAIVGEVGSGKSSLLSAVLGEMRRESGNVWVNGSIAYVSQQGWLCNATLKNNILFGKEFDKKRYAKVIQMCELTQDIEMLPGGDETEIGEKGINLSGGQKLRVSLARAVYSNADIFLLDDPLSALDSHVGKDIFENCLFGELAGKTRLLVTHQLQHLYKCDQIILLENGRITEMGDFKTLSEGDSKVISLINKHTNQKEEAEEEENTTKKTKNALDLQDDDAEGGSLIGKEKKEKGGVKPSVVFDYLKSLGFVYIVPIIFLFACKGVMDGYLNIWLNHWTNATRFMNETGDSDVEGIKSSWFYFGIYASLGLMGTFFVFFANLAVLFTVTKGSKESHENLLHKIIHQPMSFFDTTPTGRVLNRFGADQFAVDVHLPGHAISTTAQIFSILVIIVVIGYVSPIFLITLIPLGFFYKNAYALFMSSMREFQRLKGITRSPILSLFQESLNGLAVIRAFKREIELEIIHQDLISRYAITLYSICIGQRWFSMRLEFMGAIVVFLATFFSILIFRNTVGAGFVGLAVTYSLQLSGSLNWLTRTISEAESSFISVERIMEYTNLETEAPLVLEHRPLMSWPSQGKIQMQNVKMKYRPGLPLVLDDVTLDIAPGHKIGICGRTGAGKSSLMLALFRIIELESGKIIIDGEDIAKMGLGDLRRSLSIIPQNPTLFTGTIKYNIDPFELYDDVDIWRALEATHLSHQIKAMDGQLEAKVTEGGNNLSVGTKQLLCLARALLKKSKILIMDEATANVDYETDLLIQTAIQEGFKDSTVLTIAHRINTILNYDRALVLKQGQVAEYDRPSELLKDKDSIFFSLAHEAGLV